MASPLSSISFVPQGAIIQSITINGKNIVLGFPRASDYKDYNFPYFGETIGRVANRISGAQIDSLNGGKSYKLSQNNGPCSLHGGPVGWGKQEWRGENVKKADVSGKERDAVLFTLTSKDGDEGYPGTVEAKVWYIPYEEDGKTILEMEYEAKLVGDEVEETVINMTNHR
jgi:aldose 1-epimerase